MIKEISSLAGDSVSVVAENRRRFLNEILRDLLVRDCVQPFFHLVSPKKTISVFQDKNSRKKCPLSGSLLFNDFFLQSCRNIRSHEVLI